MNPGRLSDRIEFLQQTLTSDGEGGWNTIWAPAFTRWGKIRDVTARESVQYQQLGVHVDKSVYVTTITGIDETMRVRDRAGNEYRIQGIRDQAGGHPGKHSWKLYVAADKVTVGAHVQ